MGLGRIRRELERRWCDFNLRDGVGSYSETQTQSAQLGLLGSTSPSPPAVRRFTLPQFEW